MARIDGSRRFGLPRLLGIFVALGALVISGCGGGGSGGNAGGPLVKITSAALQVVVRNAISEPIEGAIVAVDIGGSHKQVATSGDGIAVFTNLLPGRANVSVSAEGFESQSTSFDLGSDRSFWEPRLLAIGAWAAGRAIVMGTETVALSGDGSRLTFSVDVAVISGEEPEPIETLTDADFGIVTVDCGWSGPRECASDRDGNVTAGDGYFSTDGAARAFELRAAPGRLPYLVGVLAERSGAGTEWQVKGPALKSFAEMLGGNDAMGLASVQVENNAATLTLLGPFTSDGSTFFPAIDGLGQPAGESPTIQAALLDSIRWTAEARDLDFPGREATLLVLSDAGLSVEEIDEATALARQSQVRVSVAAGWIWGLPEIAVRTGGFVAELDDVRQHSIVMGALDRTLGGEMPYYRMQFELGGVPGVFVRGGNVKIHMHIDLPASVPNGGVWTHFDVAIP